MLVRRDRLRVFVTIEQVPYELALKFLATVSKSGVEAMKKPHFSVRLMLGSGDWIRTSGPLINLVRPLA